MNDWLLFPMGLSLIAVVSWRLLQSFPEAGGVQGGGGGLWGGDPPPRGDPELFSP